MILARSFVMATSDRGEPALSMTSRGMGNLGSGAGRDRRREVGMGVMTVQAAKTVTNLTPPQRRDPEACGEVRLWSYPKVVFFYPTLIAAIAAGVLTKYVPEQERVWAWCFIAVLGVNLVVVSFDFPRTTALNFFFLGVALLLGAILVNAFVWEFFPLLDEVGDWLEPAANAHFYWLVGGGLALVYAAIIVIDRRFDYYTVEPLRIVHHSGPWDTRHEYPALGSTVQKDIDDVFEYLLLRSGRLVLQPERGPAIVLENVPGIDKKIEQIESVINVVPTERVGAGHLHVP
jgi:hypothetical protein